MGGDPAAPITPRQIGILLLILRKKEEKKMSALCVAPAAVLQGPPTAALQCFCEMMQSDGMVRYTREQEHEHGSPGAYCR